MKWICQTIVTLTIANTLYETSFRSYNLLVQLMYRHLIAFSLLLALSSAAHATLITQVFSFNNNDSSVVNSVTSTFTDANISIEFTLTVSAAGGTAVDSSAGDGIGVSGNGSDDINDVSESLTFDVAITSVTVLNGAYRTIRDVTFARIGGVGIGQGIYRGFFQDSGGSFTVPDSPGPKPWQDSNSPFPGESSFVDENFHAFRLYSANAKVPHTTFTSNWVSIPGRTDAFNSWALNNIEVGVTANPEPSSMALGLVAIGGVVCQAGRRRFKKKQRKA